MKQLLTKLLFLFFLTGSLCAQSPGGVGSPELWFQAKPASTDLRGNYLWKDHGGDHLRLNIYDPQGAGFGEEFTNTAVRYYNGYPALDLFKLLDTKSKEVQFKRTNLSQATIVGVFAPSAFFDKEMMLYGLNGRPSQGVFVGNNKIYPSRESGKTIFDYGETEGMDIMYSSNDIETDLNHFREKSMRIAAYYRSVAPSTGLWGEKDRAVISFGSYNNKNVNNSSTFSIPSSDNRQFSGYAPEFIVYNRLLTPLERRQVDSYLALKYGLSLPVSFIGSNQQVIWDYDANSNYNYRITGIYRDNISGLYQTEASTSYESAPNYSDDKDYFHNGNPYNRSSSSRLLVFGRQYGNQLTDGSHLVLGDDNHSIKLKSIDGVLGFKIMDRQWLVRTNIAPTAPTETQLDWDIYDLDFTTKGFISSVKKPAGSSAPEQAYAYTKTALSDRNGYLGLFNTGGIKGMYLKFGGNQGFLSPGRHDYGYYILDGKVYPIIQGVVSSTSVTTLVLVSRIEIEKEGDLVYLRIDGTRLPQTEIEIQPQDSNKTYYGALSVIKGALESQFDLRHGGFVDTGNKIELSYASNSASEFKDNNQGRSFLLVDRTGAGNFDLDACDVIEVDEIDGIRQKAIFNNVFLNSGDVFTFAYRESDLSGDIEVTDPDCGQSNGELLIQLTSGTRAFKYTLTNLRTAEVVKSGRENSYTIHITGISAGDYQLKVEEAGGYNFENIDPNKIPTRAKTTNFFPVFEGGMEWMVSNITDTYMIGWTNFTESVNNPKNIIHYGLKKQGNKIYKVVAGKLESTNVTVQQGDVLKITKTMNKVFYYKNGVEFSSNSIKWYDVALKFYGLIDMSEGKAEILNVNAQGFFNLADYNWSKMDNLNIAKSRDAFLTFDVTLEDGCSDGIKPPVITPAAEPVNKLKVYSVAGANQVSAQVELDEPEPVSFMAIDLNGNTVKIIENKSPQKLQEATINVPTKGIYIIRAITTNKDHTKKIIVE